MPWLLGALLALGGGAHRDGTQAAAGDAAASAAGPGASRARFNGQGGPGGGPRIQPVAVAAVKQQDIRVTLQAIGTITASNTAVVRSKIEGELKTIHFKEGQQVRAGALLAELDNRAQQIALAQAEGQLARDQAQLANARTDLARFKDLLAKDGIARQQVDTQEALVRQLQGTVQTDQALVENAKLQLSYTRITAPIAGRIGLRQADLGNVVRPSDTNGLLSIAQTQPVNVVFAVPDQHLPRISEALAKGRALKVEAWDRDQKRLLATGQVTSTDNAIDATTSTIRLKAAFPNADASLYPNQFVNVRLQLGSLDGVLTVPAAAVLRNADGQFVYLVGEDRSVSVRPVRTLATDGDVVGVQGDLRPGDQVVTDGVDRLREGAKVEIIQPGRDGGRRERGERRADGPASGAGQAPAPAGSAAVRGEERRASAAGGDGRSERPSGPRTDRSEARSDAQAGSAGGGEPRPGGGGFGGPSPERLAEILQRLPPDVAERVKAMSPEERRAWFQQRRAERERREAAGQ